MIITTILQVVAYLGMNCLIWKLVFEKRQLLHVKNNINTTLDKEFLAKLAVEVAKIINEVKEEGKQ